VLKREETTAGWREIHNEKLHNLFPSPNVITAIKSIAIKWMGHVTDEKCMQDFCQKT
jgi:hypothetical protein